QGGNGILDAAEELDAFGQAVAAGDFNGDGFDDLASGVPFEDMGTLEDAGAVNAIYGRSGGLAANGNQLWNQDAASPIAEPTASASSGAVPEALALLPATPNPARGQATLRFTQPEAGHVRLAVYDAIGREVAVLVDGSVEAGVHEAALDGGALPAGVYVVRMTAGGRALTQRVTVIR
ncbi:MAG TPA: T9SS type A sorting domain-containing protein, partial [Anaeromyxobacteraceae bacterium]|nr:T9SS type A sorting domain-containing protein [Anaeromyxobacteraceae bacterium]